MAKKQDERIMPVMVILDSRDGSLTKYVGVGSFQVFLNMLRIYVSKNADPTEWIDRVEKEIDSFKIENFVN